MRALLLVALLALLAGCASPAPSPPANDTLSPTFFQQPSPVPGAFEPVEFVHAYSAGDLDIRSLDVPSSAGRLTLHMILAGQDVSACDQAAAARITLSDPSNKRYALLDAARTDFRDAASGTCDAESVTATFDPGTWTVAFAGQGAVVGVVHLGTT